MSPITIAGLSLLLIILVLFVGAGIAIIIGRKKNEREDMTSLPRGTDESKISRALSRQLDDEE
jgi:hypothetical protein